MAKGVSKTGLWDNLDPDEKEVSTHDDVHTHTPNDVVRTKVTKNKRIQMLTYDDLIRRMDSYAKRNAMSRAEVFEQAVSEFLDRNT